MAADLTGIDNVGEFFFDLPLIRYFDAFGVDTVYVVKGGPSQNDLTIGDIDRYGIGFDGLSHVTIGHTGTDAVGCDLDQVSSAGNAAGTGARIALLDLSSRALIDEKTRAVEKIETAVEGAEGLVGSG